MTTTYRILRSALLLSVALTVGFTTAALAGGPRVPVRRPPISGMKLPPPQPPQQGGVIGGGGGGGALCYDQAPGCHQPY